MRRLAVVLLAVLCLPVSAAHAALFGEAPATLTQPSTSVGTTIAITPSGWSFVAYSVQVGQTSQIWARWRAPRGRFGKAARIGTGQVVSALATSDDFVALAWQDTRGGEHHVTAVASVFSPGSMISSATPFADNPSFMSLHADAHGTALAVATDNTGVHVVTRRPDSDFTHQQVLTGAGPSGTPVLVAGNSKGDFAIASSSGPTSDPKPPTVWVRPAGTTRFGPGETLPIRPGLVVSGLAVTPTGSVALTTMYYPYPFSPESSTIMVRPPNGSFAALPQSSPGGYVIALAAGPGSGLTLFMQDSWAPAQTRTTLPGGGLTAPVQFAPAHATITPPVSTSHGDQFMGVALNDTNPLVAVAGLSESPASGRFSPVIPVGPPGSGPPMVAANSSGALAMSWTEWVPIPGDWPQIVTVAAVRDDPVELAITKHVITVSGGDLASVPVACTGLKDCAGSIVITPRRQGARATTRNVRVRRETTAVVRLRLHHLGRGSTRATVRVRISSFAGRRISRTSSVVLSKP